MHIFEKVKNKNKIEGMLISIFTKAFVNICILTYDMIRTCH